MKNAVRPIPLFFFSLLCCMVCYGTNKIKIKIKKDYYPYWISLELPDILLSSCYILSAFIRHCSRKRRRRTNEQNRKFKKINRLQTVVKHVIYKYCTTIYQTLAWTFITIINQSINQFISRHSTEARATVRLCRIKEKCQWRSQNERIHSEP